MTTQQKLRTAFVASICMGQTISLEDADKLALTVLIGCPCGLQKVKSPPVGWINTRAERKSL